MNDTYTGLKSYLYKYIYIVTLNEFQIRIINKKKMILSFKINYISMYNKLISVFIISFSFIPVLQTLNILHLTSLYVIFVGIKSFLIVLFSHCYCNKNYNITA